MIALYTLLVLMGLSSHESSKAILGSGSTEMIPLTVLESLDNTAVIRLPFLGFCPFLGAATLA